MNRVEVESQRAAPGMAALWAVPGYPSLAAAVLLLGLASSLAGPYMGLYGTNAVGMSPAALGVYMTSLALSGIVSSTVLGGRSDLALDRRKLVLASMGMAAVGYVLLALLRSYVPALLAGAVFLGAGAAAFPQIFALAQASFSGTEAGARGVTALRSVFSLAWVVGPGVGALVLGSGNFLALFGTAAGCFALALWPVSRLPAPKPRATRQASITPGALVAIAPRRSMNLVMAAFVLYGMANSMASLSFPLLITRVLHQPTSLVGLLIGFCALLEIPVMLALALMPRRVSTEGLVIAAFGLFAAYGLIAATATGAAPLLAGQVVRAVVIAIAATQGMAYFQELMPSAVGRATALFANSSSAGGVLAGVVAGSFAQGFGFQNVFWLCAAASVLASGLLALAARNARARGG